MINVWKKAKNKYLDKKERRNKQLDLNKAWTKAISLWWKHVERYWHVYNSKFQRIEKNKEDLKINTFEGFVEYVSRYLDFSLN